MINLKKVIPAFILVFGMYCLFFAVSAKADTGTPDLTVSAIRYTSPDCQSTINGEPGVQGTLSVTIKNLGGALTSSAGLLNWSNNLSAQGFVFMSPTPSILDFQLSRALPTVDDPLGTNESIIFTWVGRFDTAGTKNLE